MPAKRQGLPGNGLRWRVLGVNSPLCLQQSPAFSTPWQELLDLSLLTSAGRRPGYQVLDHWCSVPTPTCSGGGCGRAMC